MSPRRMLDWAARGLRGALAVSASRPLLVSIVMALVIVLALMGTARTLTWMETPEFCGQCHTMSGEVEAHARSPHQTVECTECHMSRGFAGFVKAKWDGMQQMVKLVTGTYARPIVAGAHGMPPAEETCLRCHNPGRQRGDLLITRSYFQEDRNNTEQRVALVVRLADNSEQDTTGIHWHVMSDVEFVPRDEHAQVIDYVRVEKEDGTVEEFIAQDIVEISEMAGVQAEELRLSGEVREMTCYDCHNRVGHAFPTTSRAVDEAIAAGKVDPGVPYIKSLAVYVVGAEYESTEEADQAIRELGAWYHKNYPNLFVERPTGLLRSLESLALLYRQVANPQMDAPPETYTSQLGHTDSAGCFRCHDGGHFKIEDGRLTDEPIPSRCSLCHTFPSVGQGTPNVMLGPPPDSHNDRLWVFNHKDETPTLELTSSTSCSECHSQTYCSNCHATGAILVEHDNMYFDHAAVIRETSEQSCSYCHQKPACDRCHLAKEEEEVLIQ